MVYKKQLKWLSRWKIQNLLVTICSRTIIIQVSFNQVLTMMLSRFSDEFCWQFDEFSKLLFL